MTETLQRRAPRRPSAAAPARRATWRADTASVSGANALALPSAPGQTRPAPAPRRRTVLSVVPAAAGRRRVPFAVMCFLVLVAALASVLVLNISVSSGQYQLVQLQNEKTELVQRNEALVQQVEGHRAPQNLAARAVELGMVPAATVGTVDLQSLQVSGSPEPAADGGKVPAGIQAPQVLTDPVLPPGAVTPAPPAPPAESPRAAEERAGQGDTAAPAPVEAATPAEAEPEVELNGGTIPAPAQRNG